MTARARALVSFGAHLCLAAHLMGVLHVLVVRHATCPTHGEVVHDASIETEPAPIPAGAASTLSDHPAQPGEEENGHCLYVGTRRRELAALIPVHLAGAPPAAAVELTELPPSIFAVDPSTLLRLAPKTSPPLLLA